MIECEYVEVPRSEVNTLLKDIVQEDWRVVSHNNHKNTYPVSYARYLAWFEHYGKFLSEKEDVLISAYKDFVEGYE